jgi:hypothetical protein
MACPTARLTARGAALAADPLAPADRPAGPALCGEHPAREAGPWAERPRGVGPSVAAATVAPVAQGPSGQPLPPGSPPKGSSAAPPACRRRDAAPGPERRAVQRVWARCHRRRPGRRRGRPDADRRTGRPSGRERGEALAPEPPFRAPGGAPPARAQVGEEPACSAPRWAPPAPRPEPGRAPRRPARAPPRRSAPEQSPRSRPCRPSPPAPGGQHPFDRLWASVAPLAGSAAGDRRRPLGGGPGRPVRPRCSRNGSSRRCRARRRGRAPPCWSAPARGRAHRHESWSATAVSILSS